jgi:hypothetical protein
MAAFWGLLGAFTAAYNINMLVSGYQSIDVHCIVLPVKYDGGLSISVLRNKQLYEKMDVVQIFNLQSTLLKKRTDPGKVSLFLELIFLVNGMDNPTSNLT